MSLLCKKSVTTFWGKLGYFLFNHLVTLRTIDKDLKLQGHHRHHLRFAGMEIASENKFGCTRNYSLAAAVAAYGRRQ